jgi:hypothetical protein
MCEYAIFFGIEEIPGLLELVEGNERSASDENTRATGEAQECPDEKPSPGRKQSDTHKLSDRVE